jgi:tRNA-Thr(GGU) m(6)t(6)A37 methyltransferase TsaA
MTADDSNYTLSPIAYVRSSLLDRSTAPRQGNEGAPDAWLEFQAEILEALDSVEVGQEVILITWFHRARREVLKVHPRGCKDAALAGVFATRSPDRPNPLGLHRVTVLEIVGNRMKVGPLEAIDGTPVVDVKPVLPGAANG